MLRSSVHPQYPSHPSFKNIGEAPKTRQSKDKMTHHPYPRRVVGPVLPIRLYPISGLSENFEVDRDIVLRGMIDLTRTGWKQLQSLMNLALKSNDQPLLNTILQQRLPLTVLDNEPNDRTLWHALQMDDVDTATQLVRAGTDLNRRQPGSGATYLHWLASKVDQKYLVLAGMMMEFGADVNATDKRENSVLHVAAEFGTTVLVEQLIRRNAQIDVVNKTGHSVVYAAAKGTRAAEMLPLLIGYSSDVVTRNKRCIDAFYSLSDLNAGTHMFKILLDLEFPLDQYGRKGSTLLYEAVLEKKIDLVKLLLEYGADVNKKLRNGKLPLHAASQQKDPTISKLLIKKGASVHDCSDDYNGQYPIHGACKHESLTNIKLLLRLGADINVVDKNGRTPFSLVSSENLNDLQSCVIRHIAISMAKERTVNRSDLVKIRANLDTQDYYEKCLFELHAMKETDIYENISFFRLLEGNIRELSLSNKKIDIMQSQSDDRNKWEHLFPVYYRDMKLLSKLVERMIFIVAEKEELVIEISGNILPDKVVDKIVFYACLDELKGMEQDYFFSSIHE